MILCSINVKELDGMSLAGAINMLKKHVPSDFKPSEITIEIEDVYEPFTDDPIYYGTFLMLQTGGKS